METPKTAPSLSRLSMFLLGVGGVAAIGKIQEARQNQHRRKQHDADSDVQNTGALHLLGGRCAETHHALRVGGGHRHCEERKQAFHCVLKSMARIESGRNTSIIRMQKISIGNSVRKRLKRSNFKCMK